MAKNISLLGANYPNVPAVQLPQTGGGTATFYDIKVVDNLTSTSTTDALSAKQGKVLNDKITQALKTVADTSAANVSALMLAKYNLVKSNGNGAYVIPGGWSGAQFGFTIVAIIDSSNAMVIFHGNADSWKCLIQSGTVISLQRFTTTNV